MFISKNDCPRSFNLGFLKFDPVTIQILFSVHGLNNFKYTLYPKICIVILKIETSKILRRIFLKLLLFIFSLNPIIGLEGKISTYLNSFHVTMLV